MRPRIFDSYLASVHGMVSKSWMLNVSLCMTDPIRPLTPIRSEKKKPKSPPGEENSRRRKRNFKSPEILQFHSAAPRRGEGPKRTPKNVTRPLRQQGSVNARRLLANSSESAANMLVSNARTYETQIPPHPPKHSGRQILLP